MNSLYSITRLQEAPMLMHSTASSTPPKQQFQGLFWSNTVTSETLVRL